MLNLIISLVSNTICVVVELICLIIIVYGITHLDDVENLIVNNNKITLYRCINYDKNGNENLIEIKGEKSHD
jgi:hypothetical protein